MERGGVSQKGVVTLKGGNSEAGGTWKGQIRLGGT